MSGEETNLYYIDFSFSLFQVISYETNPKTYAEGSSVTNTGVVDCKAENTDSSAASFDFGTSGLQLSISSRHNNVIPPRQVNVSSMQQANQTIRHLFTVADPYASIKLQFTKSVWDTYQYLGKVNGDVSLENYDFLVVVGSSIVREESRINIVTSLNDTDFTVFIPSSSIIALPSETTVNVSVSMVNTVHQEGSISLLSPQHPCNRYSDRGVTQVLFRKKCFVF